MNIDFHKLKAIHYGTAIFIIVPTLLSSTGFIFMYGRDLFVSLDTVKLILLSFSVGTPYWLLIFFVLQSLSSIILGKKIAGGLYPELEDLEEEDLNAVAQDIFEESVKSNALMAGYFSLLSFSIATIAKVYYSISAAKGIKIVLAATTVILVMRMIFDLCRAQKEIKEAKNIK